MLDLGLEEPDRVIGILDACPRLLLGFALHLHALQVDLTGLLALRLTGDALQLQLDESGGQERYGFGRCGHLRTGTMVDCEGAKYGNGTGIRVFDMTGCWNIRLMNA